MQILWWFIPDEWFPWILVSLAIGWLVGLVRMRTVLAVGALIWLWPYIEAWLGGLPIWVQYCLAGLIALSFLRDLLAFFLGDRAADHAVGDFVGYLLRMTFWILTLPFRMIGWALRRAFYHVERIP